MVVESGRWEVCEDIRLQGHCVMLRKGSYETLRGLGLENRISSVRPLGASERYVNEAPTPVARPNYEYRRRPNEAVFEAPVTSVRAVVGPPNEPVDERAGAIGLPGTGLKLRQGQGAQAVGVVDGQRRLVGEDGARVVGVADGRVEERGGAVDERDGVKAVVR